MGDDGHALSARDPGDRVFQAGPAVRHIAWFAFSEVFSKHLGRVAARAAFNQKARKVRARNQLRVADKLQRALVSTGDTDLGQPIGHFHGALLAATAGVAQPLHDVRVVRIKAQAHDVNSFSGKRHRNFGACEEMQAIGFGCCCGAVQAANLIVVCQGP